MKVLDSGHRYSLKCNGIVEDCKELVFYKDEKINGTGHKGTTNQEVVRALIDRIKFLDSQKPHWVNQKIIYHLRQVLGLHEIRHIQRMIDEGFPIENIMPDGPNDHFIPNKSLWKITE